MKDTILKLKNNKYYYILEELSYNNKKYAFATEYNPTEETVNEEEFIVMEIKLKDDKIVIDKIHDDNLTEEVTMLFRDKFQNNN